MSGVDDEDEVRRRHFISIATGTYDDRTWKALAVASEVEQVRRWLCADELGRRSFEPAFVELAEDPTEDEVRALRDLARRRVWTSADAAVVYITGHGETADDTHYLILKETDSEMLSATAVRTSDLIGWLAHTAADNVVVIIDACYAGKLAADVLRLDRGTKRRWLVLPSATRNQKAVTGALTQAITAFLADLRSDEGRRYGELPYLDVGAFLEDVGKKLAEAGYDQDLVPLYGSQLRGPHVCLPNPHYRSGDTVPVDNARHDLALPRSDLATHWGPRSRGVGTGEDKGWLFTGRATLMRALIAATTGEPGAAVVTGGAGSGKSAALARLVTLSDAEFLEEYKDQVAAVPDDLRPPPGAVDVAVVATGKLHTQVLAQICTALRVPAPAGAHPELTVEERLASWHTWLKARERPVTIVVDALDEATHPHALLREVLARLEPDPANRRIRLLVGVRSLAAGDTPATSTAAATAALAEATQAALHARRIAVDQPPWWDQGDIVAYAASILRHTDGSPYQSAAAPTIDAIADAVGAHTGRSFLAARIAASSLAARDDIIGADDAGWLAALDEGVLGVFREDLHRSLPDDKDRYRAVILLRAVAFAYGAGLPWRNIWPLVAHAVDDDARYGGYYGDTDIAWLLDSRLGGYLVTDVEDDTTVYRLFHDLLRTTLRERWRDLLTPAPTP